MKDKPNIFRGAMVVRCGQRHCCDICGAERFVSINQPEAILINLNNSYVYWYQSE